MAWITDEQAQQALEFFFGNSFPGLLRGYTEELYNYYGPSSAQVPVPAAPGQQVVEQPPVLSTIPAPTPPPASDPYGLYDSSRGHSEAELWQPGGVQDTPVITLPFVPVPSAPSPAPIPGIPEPVQPSQPGGALTTTVGTQAQPTGLLGALDQAVGAVNNIFIAINRIVSGIANNGVKWVAFGVGAWVLINVVGVGLNLGPLKAGRRG